MGLVCSYYGKEDNRCNVMRDRWTNKGTHVPTPDQQKQFCTTDNYQKCDRYKTGMRPMI